MKPSRRRHHHHQALNPGDKVQFVTTFAVEHTRVANGETWVKLAGVDAWFPRSNFQTVKG